MSTIESNTGRVIRLKASSIGSVGLIITIMIFSGIIGCLNPRNYNIHIEFIEDTYDLNDGYGIVIQIENLGDEITLYQYFPNFYLLSGWDIQLHAL